MILLPCLFLYTVSDCSGALSDVPIEVVTELQVGPRDVDASARVDLIRAALTNQLERENKTVWMGAGSNRAVVWIDAAVFRMCSENGMYLSLGWPNIWQWFQLGDVFIFRVSPEGVVEPVSTDEIYRFCYELPSDIGHNQSLVLWIEKKYGVVCLPQFALKSKEIIQQAQHLRILERGIFYGVFFGLILIAGFGYYSLRDKTFLWYIYQLIASILIMTVESPLDCFGALSPVYYSHLYHLSMAVFYASSLVFAQYYLDTAVYHPRIHRLFSVLTSICLLYVGSYAFLPMWLRVELIYVLDLAALATLVASYYVWWKGRAAGKYFAIATMAYIPIYLHYILVEQFHFSPLIPLNDMIAFGNLFEGLVFPVALVARVRGIVAEKGRADEENARLQNEKVRAKMLAREAELRMLRFQMNPHFLFNALNSLIAEIPCDPKLSLRIAMKLSAYLRYTLTSRELVSVHEEIQAVRQYLDLEEIRFEEQLQVEFSLPEKMPELLVPMFCIQPLVENAIKYGMQTSPAPLRLHINVEQRGEGVSIEVSNTGTWSERTGKSTGLGLNNVRERLRIYYAGKSSFTTHAADGWVHVQVVINA
ncbi:MAG: histidine kinase [Kiritimatiellae bacterium]|nr:histidine kinase [Kiritimatiellia bacterium]